MPEEKKEEEKPASGRGSNTLKITKPTEKMNKRKASLSSRIKIDVSIADRAFTRVYNHLGFTKSVLRIHHIRLNRQETEKSQKRKCIHAWNCSAPLTLSPRSRTTLKNFTKRSDVVPYKPDKNKPVNLVSQQKIYTLTSESLAWQMENKLERFTEKACLCARFKPCLITRKINAQVGLEKESKYLK